MKLIKKALAVLCALVLLSSFAFAEEESVATPTDLGPVVTEEQIPGEDAAEADPEDDHSDEAPADEIPVEEPDEETTEETNEEDSAPGIEIVIARTLRPGQSWNGTIKRNTPTILKLDLERAQKIYILVKGEDVLAAVQKADRYDDMASGKLTDTETKELVIGLDAEAGSYLISLKAGDNSLLAKTEVTIMDQAAYDAWIAEHQAAEKDEQLDETAAEQEAGTEAETDASADEPEADSEQIAEEEYDAEEKPEEEPEKEPESEPVEEVKEDAGEEPEDEPEEIPGEDNEEEVEDVPETIPEPERSIEVNVTWDVPEPIIGDTAHFHAILTGYEGLSYTMQWQFSPDRKEWTDITGETNDTMDVVVTEENNLVYWRIVVYLEDDQE